MKWFTVEWAWQSTESEQERIRDDYWQHIGRLTPILPPAIAELANTINLHDGIVTAVVAGENALELTVRCGDLERGYEDIRLSYVRWGPPASGALLARMAGDLESEILYDEVDLEGRHFVHRLLVGTTSPPWGNTELHVTFGDLDLRRIPVPERWYGLER